MGSEVKIRQQRPRKSNELATGSSGVMVPERRSGISCNQGKYLPQDQILPVLKLNCVMHFALLKV